MKLRLTALAVAVSFACALPLTSLAQTTTSVTPTAPAPTSATTKKDFPIHANLFDTEVTARVVELDVTNRLATFQTVDNDFVTVRVPAKVRNFDQIRVGDELVVHYTVAVAARINPAIKNAIRETVESGDISVAKKGRMPGMISENNVQVLANIQAINTKTRTVTIRGAIRTITVTVPDDIDISKLQVGDQVQAEYSDAVAIDIEHAPAAKK